MASSALLSGLRSFLNDDWTYFPYFCPDTSQYLSPISVLFLCISTQFVVYVISVSHAIYHELKGDWIQYQWPLPINKKLQKHQKSGKIRSFKDIWDLKHRDLFWDHAFAFIWIYYPILSWSLIFGWNYNWIYMNRPRNNLIGEIVRVYLYALLVEYAQDTIHATQHIWPALSKWSGHTFHHLVDRQKYCLSSGFQLAKMDYTLNQLLSTLVRLSLRPHWIEIWLVEYFIGPYRLLMSHLGYESSWGDGPIALGWLGPIPAETLDHLAHHVNGDQYGSISGDIGFWTGAAQLMGSGTVKCTDGTRSSIRIIPDKLTPSRPFYLFKWLFPDDRNRQKLAGCIAMWLLYLSMLFLCNLAF